MSPPRSAAPRLDSDEHPSSLDRWLVFDSWRSCGAKARAQLAVEALDRFTAWRVLEQQNFVDVLVTVLMTDPNEERCRTAFELAPSESPDACVVTTTRMIGERSGTITPITPRRFAADPKAVETTRALARLLGGRGETRTSVPAALLTDALRGLVRTGPATTEPCCHAGLAMPWRTDVAALWSGAPGPRSWRYLRDDRRIWKRGAPPTGAEPACSVRILVAQQRACNGVFDNESPPRNRSLRT